MMGASEREALHAEAARRRRIVYLATSEARRLGAQAESLAQSALCTARAPAEAGARCRRRRRGRGQGSTQGGPDWVGRYMRVASRSLSARDLDSRVGHVGVNNGDYHNNHHVMQANLARGLGR